MHTMRRVYYISLKSIKYSTMNISNIFFWFSIILMPLKMSLKDVIEMFQIFHWCFSYEQPGKAFF